MQLTGRIARVVGSLVLAALVCPALPGGGSFCAHAAAAGLKKCCCDHSDGRGVDIAGPMGCCRFETPTTKPTPPATPAGDAPERTAAPAAWDVRALDTAELGTGPHLPPPHPRAESPPATLFLLNASFRI